MAFFYFVIVILCIFQLTQGTVPASNGTFPINFLWTSKGSTSNGEFSWDLSNNIGYAMSRGKNYTAFSYYSQQWPGTLRWINIVGVANDASDFCIIYLDFKYWDNIVVSPFWEQDLSHTLSNDNIDRNGIPGTFTDRSDNFAKIALSFPALNTLVPTKLYNTNISMSGNDIYFDRTHGWQMYNNVNYSIYAFSFVNCDGCPKNCPECTPSPWYEIHHSAVSPDKSKACFGIYYIYPAHKSFVQWNYTFCWPELVSPNITYDARWTTNLDLSEEIDAYDEPIKRLP